MSTQQQESGLEAHGIENVARVHWNLSVPALYEEAVRRREALIADGGPLVCRTGQHTGRSPNDKFIVQESSSDQHVWWGKVNRPIQAAQFDALREQLLRYLEGKELFVQDCFAGADPDYRLPIRIITEQAWHSLFARHMFIRGENTSACAMPSPGSPSSTRPASMRLQDGTPRTPRCSSSCISTGSWCSSAARATRARSRSRSSP